MVLLGVHGNQASQTVGMMGLGVRSGGLPEAPGMPKPEPTTGKALSPLPVGLWREKAGLLEKARARPDLKAEPEGVTAALSHGAQTPLH